VLVGGNQWADFIMGSGVGQENLYKFCKSGIFICRFLLIRNFCG
jgi:hypothetical protein